ATNVLPLPISTAALTLESLPICSIAAEIPSGTPGLRAFTGGVTKVMIAMSLSFVSWAKILQQEALFRKIPRQILQLIKKARVISNQRTTSLQTLDQCAKHAPTILLRRHSDRAIEADCLAVEHVVLDDVLDQGGILLRLA